MRGFLLLCDFAEQLNGKLYIMGGGFSQVQLVRPTFDVSVAAKILVPWTQTNERHKIMLALLDGDGRIVEAGEDSRPVQVEGEMEIGRPPGLAHGTELDLPVVWRFEDIALPAGRYRWELSVNDELIADATLDLLTV